MQSGTLPGHVARVHLHHDQRAEHLGLQLGQLGTHLRTTAPPVAPGGTSGGEVAEQGANGAGKVSSDTCGLPTRRRQSGNQANCPTRHGQKRAHKEHLRRRELKTIVIRRRGTINKRKQIQEMGRSQVQLVEEGAGRILGVLKRKTLHFLQRRTTRPRQIITRKIAANGST